MTGVLHVVVEPGASIQQIQTSPDPHPRPNPEGLMNRDIRLMRVLPEMFPSLRETLQTPQGERVD
jgi:hypothetical protein